MKKEKNSKVKKITNYTLKKFIVDINLYFKLAGYHKLLKIAYKLKYHTDKIDTKSI